MPSAVRTAGLVSVSSCRKWTEVDHEVGGSPVNWPQTRSNARSFLHHFLTPWELVYSIEVTIFSIPIYMLLPVRERLRDRAAWRHQSFRSRRTEDEFSCSLFVSVGWL